MSLITPLLHIYTTEIDQPEIGQLWNDYYLPYIKDNIPNYEVTHFVGKRFEKYCVDSVYLVVRVNGGKCVLKDKSNIDKEKLAKPYLIFDFDPGSRDNDDPNVFRLAFHGSLYNNFSKFSLPPFIMENGTPVTFVSVLHRNLYQVFESSFTITNKDGNAIQIPCKTIKVNLAILDTKEKIQYLYQMVQYFKLNHLIKVLETAELRKEVLRQTKPGQETEFLTVLQDAISLTTVPS